MSVRRSLIVLAIVALVLPVLVFGLQAQSVQTQAAQRNVQLYTVQRGDLQNAISLVGTVEAESVVHPGFTTGGRVAEILVNPGDQVAEGGIIARLENDTQRVAFERARLNLQMAQLQLQDVVSPVDDADIRVAQANVNSAWGAYASVQNAVSDEDIQAAELRYQQAVDALEEARHARVVAGNARSPRDYTILEAQIGQSSFNAEIARLQLESLRNGDPAQLGAAYARVIQAQRDLDQLLAGPTQAAVNHANIAVRQAQEQVNQAETAYNHTLLTAPFAGIVSAVNIEVGALVVPGLPVAELTDISPLHVDVQIDEVDIRQVRDGMPVTVQLDALPGVDIGGTLTDIALVGTDQAGVVSYDAEVTLNNPGVRVRVGMTADASVVVDARQNVLVVPNLYIRLDRQQDKAFVNVVQEDGSLKEVEITLGLQGQDSSEVISGLREGDVIAVDLSGNTFSIFGS